MKLHAQFLYVFFKVLTDYFSLSLVTDHLLLELSCAYKSMLHIRFQQVEFLLHGVTTQNLLPGLLCPGKLPLCLFSFKRGIIKETSAHNSALLDRFGVLQKSLVVVAIIVHLEDLCVTALLWLSANQFYTVVAFHLSVGMDWK